MLASDQWGISAIVLWELAKLSQLGRIDLGIDRSLRGRSFRSDAADEIIAATSLVHHVPLVTRDRRIRSSGLVPLAG